MQNLSDVESKTLDLGDGEFAIGFLINDKQNQAADPIAFKVAKKAIKAIASSAIGKPWIPGTKGQNKKHLRDKNSESQTDVIDFHRAHAGGEIKQFVINEETGNVSVIIEVYPEYRGMIDNGKVSDYLSPMIGDISVDPKTGEITGGEIIHIHSVDVPGYDTSIAKFQGTCKGVIGKCMTELAPLAAAGKLREYRNSPIKCPKRFLYSTNAEVSASMDGQMGQMGMQGQEQQDPVVGGLDQIKTSVAAMAQQIQALMQVSDANAAVLQEAAAAANIDASRIMTSANAGQQQPQQPQQQGGMPPMGAAGDDKISKLEAQIIELKKKETEKETKLKSDQRIREATIIARGELALKEAGMTKKNLKERIEHYVGLQNEAEELVDLSLMSQKYEGILDNMVTAESQKAVAEKEPELVAASGLLYDDAYPIQESTESDIDYDKLEANLL